ncbi:MAG TPA: MFS transporter, partial [Acidobacteriaceae bacterium]|nr:MFS transporter [Acidobacteriaceae bacterium]
PSCGKARRHVPVCAPMSRNFYNRYLTLIAGLGGLLYGIDIGIIAAALLYLSRTVDLTLGQTSIIVAAVLGGSMVSSPVAGVLAEWFGRKRMMIVSGLMFVASVGIIVLSQSFVSLLIGRLLQGMSGGVIAVVVPLYLAECLAPKTRGRGTAVFQVMLTFGIVVAALVGFYFTRQAEHAIALAGGNAVLVRAAENHAWRNMFLTVVYPGAVFFLGAFLLSESPRWLRRKGRTQEAHRALLRSLPEDEANRELEEMAVVLEAARPAGAGGHRESLLQRKYVVPFVLACVVLAANQTTGINSVLQFLVVILRQAGLSATHATQGDVGVKLLNFIMSLVAVALVDRKGRRFLLRLGTGGVVVALFISALLFWRVERQRVDVKDKVVAAITGDTISLPIHQLISGGEDRPMVLSVLYSYGNGNRLAAVSTSDHDPVLVIRAESSEAGARLTIQKATVGPIPGSATSGWIALCMGLFIAAYAVGPGVVVWLVLSELMPVRIRSTGMGIALLLNQGVSAGIAALFLPVVGRYGYAPMFLFWSACTVIYFVTATFFIPETKGKTLEEIEIYFASRGSGHNSATT